MRFISLLLAALVCVTLYFLVLDRDSLMALAGRDPSDTTTTDAPAQAEEAPVVSVLAQKSTARTIDRAVLLRGQTEAARQVDVRAETTGTVISEPLRRGSEVATGDTLCVIDRGTRDAALSEAKARLTEAEINANAALKLQEGGYGSDTAAASATASLQAAQAGVDAAEKEIERTKITAPFAGLLETDTAETGSFLTAGGLCATVIQLDPMKLVGFVPETEVDRVTLGAQAGARLATGQEIVGRVTFLSRSADPDTRTFRVEVQVPNAGGAIRDGQTVEMVIAAEGATAHLLPASALTLNDDGNLGVRIVDSESRAAFVAVELLRDTPKGVWITGLPETADVIIVGQEYVTDGVTVAPTFREAAE